MLWLLKSLAIPPWDKCPMPCVSQTNYLSARHGTTAFSNSKARQMKIPPKFYRIVKMSWFSCQNEWTHSESKHLIMKLYVLHYMTYGVSIRCFLLCWWLESLSFWLLELMNYDDQLPEWVCIVWVYNQYDHWVVLQACNKFCGFIDRLESQSKNQRKTRLIIARNSACYFYCLRILSSF